MNILVVGDVVGKPGRHALNLLLPTLRTELSLDLIIANGENAAGGRGITPGTAEEMLAAGVDVITSGNHVWAYREFIPYLDGEAPILRPLNYPPGTPGRGLQQLGNTAVVNVMGRVFMPGDLECPFRAMDAALAQLRGVPVIIVDLHAEATSEKQALAWYLDGRVSAVVGTHTHVATADPRVLPGGTASITDVGMVGPRDSVLGVQVDQVITRFLTQLPNRFDVAEGGPVLFNAVLVEVDEATGRAREIRRVDREVSLRG